MKPIEDSPAKGIKYLTLEQVLVAHAALIKRYGGDPGIRDKGLLESAIFRPRASAFGEDAYPGLFEKCAVLGHSIIKNHPFVDGNKRTGFACIHLMLLINGYDLTITASDEIAMTEKIASGKMHEPEIASWLEKHSEKIAHH